LSPLLVHSPQTGIVTRIDEEFRVAWIRWLVVSSLGGQTRYGESPLHHMVVEQLVVLYEAN